MTAQEGLLQSGASGQPVDGDSQEFITFFVGDQLFGIPVLRVQDVLSSCSITRIPLAPTEVIGSLNLRGRVVTSIDVRLRIGIVPQARDGHEMSIVVEHDGELYGLMVDSVGEVLPLTAGTYERNPPTLDSDIRRYSEGVYRLDDRLLVALDVSRLLDYGTSVAA